MPAARTASKAPSQPPPCVHTPTRGAHAWSFSDRLRFVPLRLLPPRFHPAAGFLLPLAVSPQGAHGAHVGASPGWPVMHCISLTPTTTLRGKSSFHLMLPGGNGSPGILEMKHRSWSWDEVQAWPSQVPGLPSTLHKPLMTF